MFVQDTIHAGLPINLMGDALSTLALRLIPYIKWHMRRSTSKCMWTFLGWLRLIRHRTPYQRYNNRSSSLWPAPVRLPAGANSMVGSAVSCNCRYIQMRDVWSFVFFLYLVPAYKSCADCRWRILQITSDKDPV